MSDVKVVSEKPARKSSKKTKVSAPVPVPESLPVIQEEDNVSVSTALAIEAITGVAPSEVPVSDEIVVEESSGRRVLNRDTFHENFSNAVNSITEFRTTTPDLAKPTAAFLRKQEKVLKKLLSDSSRLMRPKKPYKNTNSGIMKPVLVSKEFAKFAGWPEKELHSRVDAGKAVMNYVRANNLYPLRPDGAVGIDGQPLFAKNFIVVDRKLSKLFAIDEQVIKFPHIHRYTQRHFKSVAAA